MSEETYLGMRPGDLESNTSYVDEYIGKQVLKLAIQFKPPETFGLNSGLFEQAGVQTAICAEVGPASYRGWP